MKLDETDVTGDHAINVNAVTRQQQRKLILDSLPKKAQELLNLNIRKYDGKDASEALRWFKDIEEWIIMDEFNLISIFDLLLTDEAGILWKDFKCDGITTEDAKKWFTDSFTVKKSFSELILELAMAKQEADERFATFEIRVRNVINVVNSRMMK